MDRLRLLYGLLLAYQGMPRDITSLPYTARTIALANAELRALQAGNFPLADAFAAASARHAQLLTLPA